MPKILLRSSWQTVNIGDIGHTPGLLRLLTNHLPEAEITLWANKLDRGVGAMLSRDFPQLKLYESGIDDQGLPTHPEVLEAWHQADFLLHGSGPYLVARNALEGWHRHGGNRPFGVFGISLEACDDDLRALLEAAAFIYFRDSISLGFARQFGIECPVMEFAPDAAFGARETDDAAALAFLTESGLNGTNFICVVPRLRYTPYYQIQERAPNEQEKRKAEVSAEFKEADHAKLREVICAAVREGGMRVLICPEMTYQIDLGREMLFNRLPEDVRAQTVLRETYWRSDEAASVYARAVAVVSVEMHSPILAFTQNTPAIYVRQPTDTCKGQMWRDVGLAEWMFEIDEVEGRDIADRVLKIQADTGEAKALLDQARVAVDQKLVSAIRALRAALEDNGAVARGEFCWDQ